MYRPQYYPFLYTLTSPLVLKFIKLLGVTVTFGIQQASEATICPSSANFRHPENTTRAVV